MIDTTPINPEDAQRLISSPVMGPTQRKDEARRSVRHTYYKIIGLLVAIHEGPAPSYFRVGTRNLSGHGLAFILDRPLDLGTHCSAYLMTKDGEYVQSTGAVIRCDPTSDRAYEIGLEFSDPLAIERFTFDPAEDHG